MRALATMINGRTCLLSGLGTKLVGRTQLKTNNSTVCCVYTSKDCKTSGNDNNCLAWKQVDPAIAQSQGYFY
jgi:hypothetical protein